eukprot:g37427.t1
MDQWAEKWLMEFNIDKCEVLHIGMADQGRTYTLNGKVLRSVAELRHLGVHVHCPLIVESQMDRVVKKVFGMLAFIGQCIEYGSWKDVVKLETVQKRFARMLPGLESLNYMERLNSLEFFSLERRRLSSDLIKVYKIMRGMERVNSQGLFPDESYKDQRLDCINEQLIQAKNRLVEITPSRRHCLEELTLRQQFVHWIKEALEGTNELKVFVDLASISAGENDLDVDRVACFHDAVLGYSSLLFELKPNAGFADFMFCLQKLWNALDNDPDLSKKKTRIERSIPEVAEPMS